MTGCGTGGVTGQGAGSGVPAADAAAARNRGVDTGTSLGGRPAPDFTLVNQFGQPMSPSQFRGKAVLLSFDDAVCTTVCPLTTQATLLAKELLGPAGSNVQLLGVDANPDATPVSDVMAYSRAHAMVNQWDFLTGTKDQLAATWKKYAIYAQIEQSVVDHTPALYLVVFFATWLTQTSDLKAELTGLNAYARAAGRDHLPPLTAVDGAVTEPAPDAARGYLKRLGTPLAYPVGVDVTGRIADGCGVQDQPWYALTSAAGKITWSHDGWLSPAALQQAFRQHAGGHCNQGPRPAPARDGRMTNSSCSAAPGTIRGICRTKTRKTCGRARPQAAPPARGERCAHDRWAGQGPLAQGQHRRREPGTRQRGAGAPASPRHRTRLAISGAVALVAAAAAAVPATSSPGIPAQAAGVCGPATSRPASPTPPPP
jgi:cytochrome oxidase Cu insertion factor (SCO1/SenC/PrrC family)